MTRVFRGLGLIILLGAASASAQAQTPRPAAPATRAPAPASQARLLVTVVDQTNAVLPTATVTITGIEDATKLKTIDPITATDQGLATAAGLTLGRYSVQAEFPGFETNIIKDTRVRAGDNKLTITLALEKMSDSVSVTQDASIAAADPHGSSFGTALTKDQLDALSDDPDTLQQQLTDLAGPSATIRVDSFEGGTLPPKSQIKSIHITRDAFAAENHNPNNFFIDIITQPGVGPLRGGMNTRLRDGSLSGRNQITDTVQPERAADVGLFVGGSLIQQRASFSLQLNGTNQFIKPVSNFALPGQPAQAFVSPTKQQTDRLAIYAGLDYAITKDQTLRLNYQQFSTTNSNLGIGQYDQPERAYSSDNQNYQFRIQEAGPLGRRFFTNTRLNVTVSKADSHSDTEAQTIVVNDEFTSGGAQQAGGRDGKAFTLASDLDYVRGIHSVRGGVLFDGGWYTSNAESNYLGTYTFASEAAYEAGMPLNYTQRIGDPTVSYFNMQTSLYLQDDIRIRKNLTLSAGVRYELQTHVQDADAIGPRVGMTWAPFKNGRTTLRASAGIFYDWLSPDTYEQTLRVDGLHQLEVNISQQIDPVTGAVITPVSYPNPGNLQTAVSDRYLLSPGLHFQHYRRLSSGIDQTIGQKLRVSTTYAYTLGDSLWVGDNLNAPVNGVRPDPAFGNVIEVVGDAGSHQHQVTTSVQANLAGLTAPPPPLGGGPLFDAKRVSINGSYTFGEFTNNTDGRFNVPPTGDINQEWGPAGNDIRHRVNANVSSTQIRSLNLSVSVNASSGAPYSIRTGGDDNGDGLFTDRPPGVSRNSERMPGQIWANAYAGYTFVFGHSTVPPGVGVNFGPGNAAPTLTTFAAPPRYRLQFWIQALNFTNRANYVGYSGTITSGFFLQPTAVLNPRKIDVGINLNF